MKNLALLFTLGAALGAQNAASAATAHDIASLPATMFSIADIGWEENPLDQLRAALDLADIKPIGHAPLGHVQTKSDVAAQKPATQTPPALSAQAQSLTKPQVSVGENLVAQFLGQADAGFVAWR